MLKSSQLPLLDASACRDQVQAHAEARARCNICVSTQRVLKLLALATARLAVPASLSHARRRIEAKALARLTERAPSAESAQLQASLKAGPWASHVMLCRVHERDLVAPDALQPPQSCKPSRGPGRRLVTHRPQFHSCRRPHVSSAATPTDVTLLLPALTQTSTASTTTMKFHFLATAAAAPRVVYRPGIAAAAGFTFPCLSRVSEHGLLAGPQRVILRSTLL